MEDYQGYFADCYILSENRTESFIYDFLKHFVPHRKERADEYTIPQYAANSEITFSSAEELISYLVKNRKVKHAIYWSNSAKTDLRGAEIFFTDDEHLIMGIYCETKYPNTEIEDTLFKEMREFCGRDAGYISYEATPPCNSAEFMAIVNNTDSQ
jgi:hypothetical protein